MLLNYIIILKYYFKNDPFQFKLLSKNKTNYQNHQKQNTQEIVELYIKMKLVNETYQLLNKKVADKILQQTRDKLLFKNHTKKYYTKLYAIPNIHLMFELKTDEQIRVL